MKPKPLESLNHFTVPVAIYLLPSTDGRDKSGRDEAGHDDPREGNRTAPAEDSLRV
jgi:hypothetical protein